MTTHIGLDLAWGWPAWGGATSMDLLAGSAPSVGLTCGFGLS